MIPQEDFRFVVIAREKNEYLLGTFGFDDIENHAVTTCREILPIPVTLFNFIENCSTCVCNRSLLLLTLLISIDMGVLFIAEGV